MTWSYYLVAAGFGLIFGSFFNVCIYRLPISKPMGNRSECPRCGEMIKWYDNVPVVSFIVLRGRCRRCRMPISWRYPLVELTTCGLFVLIYWWSRAIVPAEMGLSGPRPVIPELFIGLLLVSVLVIATVVDISYFIIPNAVMYPGIVAMLLLVTGIAIYRGQPGRIWIGVVSGLASAVFLVGAGLLYGAFFMKEPVRIEPPSSGEREKEIVDKADGEEDEEDEIATGIGMGDAKLLLFTGIALGFFHWYLVLVELFLGFLIGAAVSVFLVLFMGKGRKDLVPFGPFLAAGAVIALIWGQQLADLYVKLLR